MCPHTPEDHCLCRKPQPGLIQKAAEELSIDLESSALIGDALTDIQAGSAAGIKTLILVKTGRGREQLLLSQTILNPQFLIADHLLSAINIILSKPVV
jgi:D-glycero-D-manno-heptose 1,7-bisphosphate phosphatase